MPLVLHRDLRIFFAHIPKTGGSSMKDYLIVRFGPLSISDRPNRHAEPVDGLVIPPTHLSARDLEELVPAELTLSFCVVRDPLKRAMSEFRHQSGQSRMSRLGFSTWLHVMVAGARIERRLYDNHIRPQVEMIPEGSEIFRFEDGFAPIVARLDEVTGESRPDLEVGHLLKRKKEPIEVSREDMELIADFYAEDYARLGYERPNLSDYPSAPISVFRKAFAAILARLLVAKQRWDWIT
ncbi:MAG: sulfotransferase family 2 domain-containing protein [Pseudomonadota bacterium]